MVEHSLAGDDETTVSVDDLLWIAEHGSIHERMNLATQEGMLPNPVLEVLSTDRDPGVRLELVLSHDDLSENILSRLAFDNDATIRRNLAGIQRNLPEKLQFALAESADRWVSRSLAMNPHISKRTMSLLIAVDNEFIWAPLIDNISTSAGALCSLLGKVSNPTLHGSLVFRLAVNEDTPVEVFSEMVKRKEKEVFASMAGNFACPVELVERMIEVKNLSKKTRKRILERLTVDSPKFKGMPVEWVEEVVSFAGGRR